MLKSANFKEKVTKLDLDLDRILHAKDNVVQDAVSKVYVEKVHHSAFRKRMIRIQNSYWADLPLTFVAILCLFLIPLLQFCIEVQKLEGFDSHKGLFNFLIWFNFLVTGLYGFEIYIKAYSFGLRRAFRYSSWVI